MRTLLLPAAGLLLLIGCATNRFPGPPMPVGLAPVAADTVADWVAQTRFTSPMMVRFQWRLHEESGTGGGRGSAMILPGDSMRFDFRLPLGAGSGAAAVIGDSSLWAEPEEDVRKLVPSFPILWAMLGRARPAAQGAELTGLRNETLTAWRAVVGADTVDYVLVHSPVRQLIADVKRDGTRLGRVATSFDAEGRLQRSRLDIPSRPARLELEFYGHRAIDGIADTLWSRPSDAP